MENGDTFGFDTRLDIIFGDFLKSYHYLLHTTWRSEAFANRAFEIYS
jgi:hypothetical protein